MNYEVLVVDDNHQAANEFARLIKVKSKIETLATDRPDEAIRIVKTYPIKVVVLDQRMPLKDGTALFRELKEIVPSIRAIMLTGEADGQEVGEALKLGFDDYIHKSEVESITNRVLLQYCAYQTDVAEKKGPNDNPFYKTHRGFFRQHTIDFFLLDVDILNPEFIFSDSWKTLVRIDAGEKKTHAVSNQSAIRFVLESEDKEKITGTAGLKAPLLNDLTLKLESAVEHTLKTTTSKEETKSESLTREFKLPDEPVDPSVLYVKSRQYEQAPVYKQIRMSLLKECKCCLSNEIVIATAYILTPRTASRQTDYHSDGSCKTISTGVSQ